MTELFDRKTIKGIERDMEERAKRMTPEEALEWVTKASANYLKNRKGFYEALMVAREICFAGKMVIDGRKLGWAKFVKEAVTSQGGPVLRTIDLNLMKIEKAEHPEDLSQLREEARSKTMPVDDPPTLVSATLREGYLDVVLWVPRVKSRVPVSYKVA